MWIFGASQRISLVCCSAWGPKHSDMTKRLNWTEGIIVNTIDPGGNSNPLGFQMCILSLPLGQKKETGVSAILLNEYLALTPQIFDYLS